MTMVIASVDLKTRQCVYASAAHEPGFVFPNDKTDLSVKDFHLLQAEASLPLGTEKTGNYKEYTVQLSPGDRLFFYTDGLYDVASPEGTIWGRSNFRRNLAPIASKFRNPQEFVQE